MSKPKQRSRNQQLKRRQRKQKVTHDSPESHASDIAAALELQQSGELEKAKQIYCKILEIDPGNADAWHLLGMTFYSAKQNSTALECLLKANHFAPNHPTVLANLGLVYRDLGNLQQATFSLQKAVALAPQSLSNRTNLGTVLLEQKDLASAAEQFEFVLAHDPTAEIAAMNLGNLRQAQGRLQDAESLYRSVLVRNPQHTLVLNNLGESLRKQGKGEEAVDVLTQAVALDPDSVDNQINLGRMLIHLHRVGDAQQLFSRIIKQYPETAKAYHYLGKACFKAGDMEGARVNIERALELDPDDAYAHCSLAFVFLATGQSSAARKCFNVAVELDPDHASAHSSLLFVMSGDLEMDPQKLFLEHQRWGTQHGNVTPLGQHKNDRNPTRRLRVGYVSPDFQQHAVAAFFRPVLESHDPANVETYCYSEVEVPDDMTHTLQGLAHHWRSTVELSDEQVARQVMADEIDILVDLAGHTARNRLKVFAYRPAPVQVTWLGYPNTTGLPAIDYRLTCDMQNPLGEEDYHTEQLVRMKFGSFCYTAPAVAPQIYPAPALKNGTITFGSLHRPFKISPAARALWAAVLQAIPDSQLILFNTGFTEQSAASLRAGLVELGIDAGRIQIRNEFAGETYLTVYDEIDIALDVTPWAGGTTTLEALWMGIPVIGYYGQRRSARSTAAILKQVGLSDLVASTESDYARLARELSTDIPRLTSLRSQLRGTLTQTICNATRFTTDLEQEFQKMWSHWCNQSNA